jgi:hypothetical protein
MESLARELVAVGWRYKGDHLVAPNGEMWILPAEWPPTVDAALEIARARLERLLHIATFDSELDHACVEDTRSLLSAAQRVLEGANK